ncbi:hypothetical protein B0H14DRAFT_3160269 [Mycena olivaceomarginata]|nr:hypothetical protein B0H14DRAFT_3160269 [Mycena olivaceomarginata]
MTLQPHSEREFTVVSMTNNAGSAPYSGAFFPGAAGFTIGGGNFTSNVTNNVFNPPLEQLSAFRTIRLGDIKLGKELRFDDSGVVRRCQGRGAIIRRMYSAKIMGRETGPMTIAIYQGDGAEKWQQLIEKYESIRHPKIMQLYGLVRTKGLHAMVFHDDLIPFRQFLNRFRHSPVLTTYIFGYCSSEWCVSAGLDEGHIILSHLFDRFQEAMTYCYSLFPRHENVDLDPSVWIRPATGELSVHLDRNHEPTFPYFVWSSEVPRRENISLDDPHAEAVVISTLNERAYHSISFWAPIRHFFGVSTQLLVQPGIFFFRSNSQLTKITESLGLDYAFREDWFDCRGVFRLSLCAVSLDPPKFWVAQANHIFAQLQTSSHFENYVCVRDITFILQLVPNTYNTQEPEGYLFVCPPEHFRARLDSLQWPTCPAYWSLDPSGVARLSTEDAKILGFPPIHIETRAFGYSWDGGVYDGLRRFHRGRGFDPESQEVALYLGYPLYKLSNEKVLFACVEGWQECDLEDTAPCEEFGHYLE